ncbi:DEAD/DEAH box helicase family protein [Massiliimalia massiliensis]|uniref:DEAD/DEAH box helicase family protein n=1 Tax=Massiliimalia massiliensis TaxID=1852384 RepID=UPI000986747E|nr:DEAD/DEAH box helicase family protein [Massiliimalia massiliensis]
MTKRTTQQASFDDQLVLFRYFLHELKIDSLSGLSEKLNSTEYEGVDESGNTYFCDYLSRICKMRGAAVTPEKLRLYDENICRHTRQIGEKRGGLRWKYFQYVALLFTEMYLDRYFSGADIFCSDLNAWLQEKKNESLGLIDFQPYTVDKLNKLAFMCATGSGKTLIMHLNILQFLHYFKRAKRLNSKLSINKIIVLAPNEGMSKQHLEELALSSIPAAMFEKDRGFATRRDDVIVIDMNKLKEEGKVKTVSVDSFEQNNLVLVDEGHRGLSGDVWYDYRTRLSAEGFAFEYSATFKQALNASATGNTQKAKDERALMEEYGKSIIMDYSYKYFYSDGYGKDYRIYNLQKSIVEEQRHLYLVGCLLSFYQQIKVFETQSDTLREFHIEKPLLVFVGNRVTAPVKSSNLTQAEKNLLTDVEEVLLFLNTFLSNRAKAIENIRAVINEDTGLYDASGKDLFYGDFRALQDIFDNDIDPAVMFADILHVVFNTDGNADEPRLRMENIRQISGEIGLKVGEYGDYFGVINIGDTSGLLKNCEQKGIIVSTEEFVSDSLFRSINAKNSKIKMLIGSRKFTEGWNSWRVSTMGLINFAKGEGSQAIQLFGRGIRLKGYEGCLKRSRKLDASVKPPKHIELLETLTIFGVKAQYMEEFKSYLEQEGTPTNETVHKLRLPVISRFKEIQGTKLYVIKVKDGADFKQQAGRLILDKPDQGFLRYLLKSKTVIDCRSKIQSIDSTFSFKIEAMPEEHVLPTNILPILDMQRIFEELQQYKSEKRYYNISVVADKLLEILRTEGWYVLLIPKHHLEINTLAKLEAATDYAIMALKSYMDKFFKYEKERWEASMLEYAILDADDSNFVDEYTITYAQQHPLDTTGDELESYISEISTILQTNNGLDVYKKDSFHGRMVMFDFRSHLYAPLICLEKSNLEIQVSPVALNTDEMVFVDYLKEYVESHSSELEGKSLYLLRNKSKVGMGFFVVGNFYPDYILWIDTDDKQYISFIDPKGLMHIRPDDPKVEFYKTIKDLEKRLAPTADGKTVILNSFIMSGTKSSDLRMWWSTPQVDADRAYREAHNVYTLDNSECVELMINKILQQ